VYSEDLRLSDVVDAVGRRRLIGLTLAEILEFERLDSEQASALEGRQVAPDGRGWWPLAGELRWLELYA
jgi:hypothetical protein